jgi:YD repeat-containing protein
MPMKLLFILLPLFVLPLLGFGQYYYKDIIATRQGNELNRVMKKNKVATVKVKNYNFDDTVIEDFLCEQYTENACRYVVTVTGSPFVGEYHLHTWYNNNSQINKSVDSTGDTNITNQYEYDPAGKLKTITINSFEMRTRDKLLEQHQFFYNAKGALEKMYVLKNITDTITVQFKTDTAGLVTEEVSYKKGREKERYYYYYDTQKRLTDVVKYNTLVSRLLPETVFEYNDQNQVVKRTDFTPGTSEYQNWLFTYDANGLKTGEMCYLKGNFFRGKLVYSYTFEKDE